MSITVVDQSKLRDPKRTVVSEFMVMHYSKADYRHVSLYSTGDADIFPLVQFARKQPHLERYYTHPFLPVSRGTAAKYIAPNGPLYRSKIDIDDTLNQLSRQVQVRSRLPVDAERVLWHSRLIHISDDSLCLLHKKVHGVPPIKPRTVIDPCPVCISTKLKKRGKFKNEKGREGDAIRDDAKVVFFQHVQVDFGFIVVRSKNEERLRRLAAYNGDTCYISLQCMKTNYVMGMAAPSKEAPLKFLQFLLAKFCPWKKKDRTFRMDEGGETGRNPGVAKLFQVYGYCTHGSGPDNSSAIGQVERFHPTVKGGIRSMIESVDWTWKVWNFAFYMYIRIWNMLPHGPMKLVPYTVITGKRCDLSKVRIFGCPVVVLENGRRPSLDDHTKRGRFLGFSATHKKIVYMPRYGKTPLTAVHVAFDELFSTFKTLPPIAIHLRRSLGMDVKLLERESRRTVDANQALDILHDHEQFAKILIFTLVPDSSVLGLQFNVDRNNRGYISGVILRSLVARTVKNWRVSLIGAFVIRVGDVLTFSKNDIESSFAAAMEAGEEFTFTVARESLDPIPLGVIPQSIPQLQLDQLRSIASIYASMDDHSAGEDVMIGAVHTRSLPNIDDLASVDSLDFPASDIQPVQLEVALSTTFDDESCLDAISELHVSTETVTVVEALLRPQSSSASVAVHAATSSSVKDLTSKNSHFTRRHLKTLPNWDDWRKAEWKMLDQMLADNMFGDIVLRKDLVGFKFDIIRIVWSYVEKLHTGKKKARVCGNGSPLRAPKKFFQKAYAACASMVGMRLLFAISAYEGRVVYDCDATNAYAQSGPLDKRTFLVCDDAFQEWYYARFHILVPVGSLCELLSSIQGHPHAGTN